MSRNGVRTRTATAAVSAALLAALAGCNSSSEAAPPALKSVSPSAHPSLDATPSPTLATPLTPEDEAVTQAERAVRAYYATMDQLGSNAAADTALLKNVSISTGLISATNEINLRRGDNYRQIGSTTLASLQVTKVDLTADLKARPAPKVPIVEVNVCYDVSGVNVVDASGRSVITAQRKDRALAVVGVVNYDWPDPSGWKVGYETVKGDSCLPAP